MVSSLSVPTTVPSFPLIFVVVVVMVVGPISLSEKYCAYFRSVDFITSRSGWFPVVLDEIADFELFVETLSFVLKPSV